MSKKTKIYRTEVICPIKPEPRHIIPIEVELELGSDLRGEKTRIEVYCPSCDDFASMEIEGNVEGEIIYRAL